MTPIDRRFIANGLAFASVITSGKEAKKAKAAKQIGEFAKLIMAFCAEQEAEAESDIDEGSGADFAY